MFTLTLHISNDFFVTVLNIGGRTCTRGWFAKSRRWQHSHANEKKKTPLPRLWAQAEVQITGTQSLILGLFQQFFIHLLISPSINKTATDRPLKFTEMEKIEDTRVAQAKKTKSYVSAHPDSDSRHTAGESVGSLLRAAACLAKTDTTPPCSSDREPRPGDCDIWKSVSVQNWRNKWNTLLRKHIHPSIHPSTHPSIILAKSRRVSPELKAIQHLKKKQQQQQQQHVFGFIKDFTSFWSRRQLDCSLATKSL